MHPYYFGFVAAIEADSSKLGIIEHVYVTTLRIFELPIETWTQDYKAFLKKKMIGDKKKKIRVETEDFRENHGVVTH